MNQIINNQVNILYALSLSNDITQFGNRRKVKIIRNEDDLNRVFYVDLTKKSSQLKIIRNLSKYYKKSDFINILNKDKLISTNDVINTNNCFISICKTNYKNKVIILSCIDNLIKGGAGQAIQNMNLKFGFKEQEGLI